MNPPHAVVEVEGLRKDYTGEPPIRALREVSFTIVSNDFVAVTGPSGSGKTTLLALLGLLDEPTAGEYRLDGQDVSGLNDRRRAAIRAHKVGFVFQAFHLIDYRTVLENVQLGLMYQGVRRPQRISRSLEVIDHVGLRHRAQAPCSTLSGGERQRVAIARVLVREPSLILCDEPTGNLDSSNTDQVLMLLDQLHSDGMTIVLITHDPAVAHRANRRFEMTDGRLSEPVRAGHD